jgi:carboxypeptidase family protein
MVGLKRKGLVGFGLICVLSQSLTAAGDICVSDPLTVGYVRGQVVSIPNQNRDPIPNTTIILKKCLSGDCKTIAEATTDENGRFSIENIRQGRYEFEAKATSLKRFTTTLYVRRGYKTKQKILVALDAGLGCGGSAKLRQ